MKFFPSILLSFVLVSCSAGKHTYLPDFVEPYAHSNTNNCTSIFPRGEWQFVHSIDFSRDNGAGTTMVGITSLSKDMIKSALVTVEGFTLFEADFHTNNRFQVRRAVPPFDSEGFAEGMMADLRTLFRPPSGDITRQGITQEGTTACRYIDTMGRVTDIMPNKDDCWQISSYTPDRIMDRSITGRSCRQKGSNRIPEYLELQTYGMTGYTLKMKLLHADILQ